MAGENAFRVEGTVVEVMANGTYRVRLANGHELRAYVAGKAKLTFGSLAPGEKVRLALSPCDLSEGRILTDKSKI